LWLPGWAKRLGPVITIPLVTVGDPGNAADPATEYGAVPYTYQIGEFDIEISEYCSFLNSVAVSADPYGLYDIEMATANSFASCGIVQSGSPGDYTYTVEAGRGNLPVNNVSWGDAARFCNWLANPDYSRASAIGQ
jgi:formylglycine-generating enzyme